MTQQEQIKAMGMAIDRVVDQFRTEFDLTYAAVIGILQMKVHLMCQEADEADDQEDSDEENP